MVHKFLRPDVEKDNSQQIIYSVFVRVSKSLGKRHVRSIYKESGKIYRGVGDIRKVSYQLPKYARTRAQGVDTLRNLDAL